MVEPENVGLAEDDPRARGEDDLLLHLAAVDEADGALHGYELDLSLGVGEDAVLAEDVPPDQLDVLADVGLGGADAGDALLDVVEQALGEGRVLVQVDEMRGLGTTKTGSFLSLDSFV